MDTWGWLVVGGIGWMLLGKKEEDKKKTTSEDTKKAVDAKKAVNDLQKVAATATNWQEKKIADQVQELDRLYQLADEMFIQGRTDRGRIFLAQREELVLGLIGQIKYSNMVPFRKQLFISIMTRILDAPLPA